jgi:hypothetical protein
MGFGDTARPVVFACFGSARLNQDNLLRILNLNL